MQDVTLGLLALVGVCLIVGCLLLVSSVRVCREWQRLVVLRLGRFAGVRGPGIVLVLPVIETTPFIIDMRETTSRVGAEQASTRDGMAVSVSAIVTWQVVDAGLAAMQVADYQQAVPGAAQSALRDIIGRNDLGTLRSQRREIDGRLTEVLDERASVWGIKIASVQIQAIKAPA